MAVVHKCAFANPCPILACFQVVDRLSPSKLLTRKHHRSGLFPDKGTCALLLLNSPVLILGAARDLLIVHGEDLVIAETRLFHLILFHLPCLSHVCLKQIEVRILFIQLSLQLVNLLLRDILLGEGLGLQPLTPRIHICFYVQVDRLRLVPLHLNLFK